MAAAIFGSPHRPPHGRVGHWLVSHWPIDASHAPSSAFFGRPRAGPRLIPNPPPSKKNRGRAGRCRVRAHSSLRRVRKLKVLRPTGLDASRHRGLSKLIVPQVRRSLGVPRAVFEVCSASPPVDGPFQASPIAVGCLSTAVDPKRCPALLTMPATARQWGPATRGQRAGTMRLGPPGGEFDAASPTPPHRPPLPAPRLETADPSVARGGMRGIIVRKRTRSRKYVKIILSPFWRVTRAVRRSFSAHARPRLRGDKLQRASSALSPKNWVPTSAGTSG